MRTLTIITFLFILKLNLFAQNNIENIMQQIEKNNPTINTIRSFIEAEKIENKIGILPQNPQVELNHLWGKPTIDGNRLDFRITQSFDFPTSYFHKSKISDLKNSQAQIEFNRQRLEILHQAHLICVNLIYINALNNELTKRYQHAANLAKAYNIKYKAGEINILEFNRSQLHYTSVKKELEALAIKRNELISQLTTLNGGNLIDFTETVYVFETLPIDFETWFKDIYAKNPLLQWIEQEAEIAQKQIKLSRSQSMPKLFAGYMSENALGQDFQGLTAGITIPLWENKNTTKFAVAQSNAVNNLLSERKFTFYNELKALHQKALNLNYSIVDFNSKIIDYKNDELLKTALTKGEISLTEYLLQHSYTYQITNQLLSLQLEFNLTIAELYKYK